MSNNRTLGNLAQLLDSAASGSAVSKRNGSISTIAMTDSDVGGVATSGITDSNLIKNIIDINYITKVGGLTSSSDGLKAILQGNAPTALNPSASATYDLGDSSNPIDEIILNSSASIYFGELSMTSILRSGTSANVGSNSSVLTWTGSFPITATANTFVYDDAILAQDGSAETTVTDAYVHPNNNIVFLCGNGRDLIYQIDLSSASDISTASYTGTNFDTTNQTATPNMITFSGDGTKMYIYSQKLNTNPGLFEYDLSTAWDITTATFNQSNTSLNDADYSYSIQFNDDGTKIYTASAITESTVYEFSLSSAYDVSTINSTATATFDYSTISEITDPTALRSMRISSDGTKIYFNINSQDEIHECTLGTAWDLSTISYSATADVSATDAAPYVLFFNSDGSEMYTINVGTDTIYQYTMS